LLIYLMNVLVLLASVFLMPVPSVVAQYASIHLDSSQISLANSLMLSEGGSPEEHADQMELVMDKDINQLPGHACLGVHVRQNNTSILCHAQSHKVATVDAAVAVIGQSRPPEPVMAFQFPSAEFQRIDAVGMMSVGG